MLLIVILYTCATTVLSLHGFYIVALLVQYVRHQRRPQPAPAMRAPVPVVTVQAPMYNERYVAERCIDALAALDWPRDRLQIQVLDDSTDDTTAIARARVEHHRRRGIDITLIHRSSRAGYKAGALAHGLSLARGEFVAVFDADFVPAADCLRRLLPHLADASIGFVQARWEHLNYHRSALVRSQSLMVDAHFVVEQFARHRSGWPMIFNGSAGVWRRSCIETSGGWHADTLCEDMDLSYRAALRGWRSAYAPEVVVPQEEPSSIGALKSQHSRWARGGAQCLRKHARTIVASPGWSPVHKLASLAYLAGFTAHLLIVLVVLLWLPLALDGEALRHIPLTFLGVGGLSLPLEYAVAQRALRPRNGAWLRRLAHLPLLLVIGFGLSFNNALAVVSGLWSRGGEFRRTPKVPAGHVAADGYVLRGETQAWFEIGLALYALVAAAATWSGGNSMTAALLLIYASGLATVGIGSLSEALRAARARSAWAIRRAAR